jgi:hypothetical protein
MSERIDRVKAHVSRHKVVYISAGIVASAAVGAGIALVVSKQIVIVDSFKFQWKSTTTNNVTTILERRGHPGNLVRCIQTGEVFASQNRAANLLGISTSKLSKHLRGLREDVDGFTFENLGEAA